MSNAVPQHQIALPLDAVVPPPARLHDSPAANETMAPSEAIGRAMRRIEALLIDGHPLVVAFSAGKDSSALAALTLNAARRLVELGQPIPPIVLTHSNPGVEQPEITTLATNEIRKMSAYAARHRIEFVPMIGQPSLNDSFPVRVIGGRGLPAFPDTRADCSTDWKVAVNERLQKQAMATLKQRPGGGDWKRAVVMTGVRQSESIARDQRISARGEVADGTWVNELGKLRASPILDWEVDDVWEYLGLCASGSIEAYSDFSETMRIYRDAGGSSCVIVADMRAQSHSKPCGSRSGCWSCTRVKKDRSMTQMIVSDPDRYGYLVPLAKLRDFISATQYDWNRRQWVGRTIDERGTIAIGPDVYSPDMLKELLLYTLSAQATSGVQIIDEMQLVAIDARWSLYGIAPPFTALKIYKQVVAGKRALAPNVASSPKTALPKLDRVHVGNSWEEALGRSVVGGLLDASASMFADACGIDFKRLSGGTLVLDYEGDDSFDVDSDGANLFLELEADRLIAEYCHTSCADWTWGMKTYLRYGTIVLGKGRSRIFDDIMRRTQWRQEHGLHGQLSLQDLVARCAKLNEAQSAAAGDASVLESDAEDVDMPRPSARG